MRLKRLAVCTAALSFLLAISLATAAQAKEFSLIGGGGQLHIGNGLALPIKAAAMAATTTTMFPTLLIPVKGRPTITGTVGKALQVVGPKSGYQHKLVVPAGVLSKPAGLKTVGVKFSNPGAFAVATNLKYVWPAAPAVFSVGAPLGLPVVSAFGGSMTYSNSLASRFGGAAQFALSPGPAAGLYGAASPVTVYAKINGTTPPCKHTAFAGPNASCVAGILFALPTGLAAPGGATPTTVMTPGKVVTPPNVAVVQMGAVPLGTIVLKAKAATAALPTNMAASQPGPWTTGKVIIANPAAGGGGETFTLSGMDSRTANGGGTIQMVSGSLSARFFTGANANRGWVRLTLLPIPPVPSMSMLGLATTVALMLLGFGYATRRRLLS